MSHHTTSWHRIPARARRGRVLATSCCVIVIAGGACRAPSRDAGGAETRRRASSRSSYAQPLGDAPGATEPEPSVLMVNGQPVTRDDILALIRPDLDEQVHVLNPAQYDRFATQAAVRATRDKIVDIVLFDKASAGLTSTEEEALDGLVTTELRRIVTERAGGSQHEYERQLQARGSSLDAEREAIRRRIIVQRYLHLNLVPKVQEPTRAELMAEFEAAKDTLTRPERRGMFLIEVRPVNHLGAGVRTPTREQREEARRTARQIIERAYRQVRDGHDFGDVARAFSEGLRRDDGGAWGWVGKDSMRPRWQAACEALWTLDAGEDSEIIETDESFFIVRCGEIQPAVRPDFESMQPQLVETYRDAQYNTLLNEMIESLINEARVEPPDIEPFVRSVVRHAPSP